MTPELTDAELRLISAYTEAALRVSRELKAFKAPADKTRILQRINAILRQLESMTALYIREDLPQRFKDGSALALAELRKLRIPDLATDFTGIHTEAVQQLAEDARLRFADAIQTVRRSAVKQLSTAEKEIILQKIMAEEIAGGTNPAAVVKEYLASQAVTALQGARTWSLEDYADMLTRAVLAEAHNTGAAMRYAANGIEYAKLIERATACEICTPMNGKIVWLGDPRLRPPFHPRCRGSIIPYQGDTSNAIKSIDDPRIPAATRKAMTRT